MAIHHPQTRTHLTPDHLSDFSQQFTHDPRLRLARNAITQNPASKVIVDRARLMLADHTFSHQLSPQPITNQKKSGRCWMFAALNLFRVEALKRLNLKEFEFSQNYLMFWDKLEKAHYFLESIIATLDEPHDGRLMMHLLQSPIQDGGQWDMFANLVKKYGVVPKSAMPETESSSSSRLMNGLITAKLREFAGDLRQMAGDGATENALRERKIDMMAVIYRMLVIHLGEPPREFFWQWRDEDEAFHRDGRLTPQEFFQKYVDLDLDSMVCLIHCPTADKPFNTLYTIDYLGNVQEGDLIRYLNVELEVFKQAAVDMLVDGRAVWFGCDVGQRLHGDEGLLDLDIYDYESAYGIRFTQDKAARIDYGQSLMTHAMVLVGVDLDDDGKPRRWKVENSWGDERGHKGYLTMSDGWFDEFNYEVLVDKRFLPDELLAVLESEPVHLPPWDPMGALAVAE